MSPAEVVTLRDCASNYGVFKVPSSSAPGVEYIVELHGSEGPAYCSCPAFQFSGSASGTEPRHCKHIDQVWKRACLRNAQWRNGPEGEVELRPYGYTYDAFASEEGCVACGGPEVYVRRAV